MKLKATKKYCQQTLLIKSKSMTFNLLGDIKKYEILSFFEKSNFYERTFFTFYTFSYSYEILCFCLIIFSFFSLI